MSGGYGGQGKGGDETPPNAEVDEWDHYSSKLPLACDQRSVRMK